MVLQTPRPTYGTVRSWSAGQMWGGGTTAEVLAGRCCKVWKGHGSAPQHGDVTQASELDGICAGGLQLLWCSRRLADHCIRDPPLGLSFAT
jgi:hypothetical protein